MGIGHYILDEDGNPVACNHILEWARWFETERLNWCICHHIGPFEVSTVFLGIDHDFFSAEPILWETMVFNTDEAGLVQWEGVGMQRCGGSREQAEEQHRRTVQIVQDVVDNPDLYPLSFGDERIRETDRDDVRGVQQDGAGGLDDDACAEQGSPTEGQATHGDPHTEGPV